MAKGGGRTSFENMSHEQMLAWLDQASSFHVQDAAARLSAAAVEIRSIAQLLKSRPERVEWEGEGFEAFVEWGASLASSTYRLADYSEGASKWLPPAAMSIDSVSTLPPTQTAPSAPSTPGLARPEGHAPHPPIGPVLPVPGGGQAVSTPTRSGEAGRVPGAARGLVSPRQSPGPMGPGMVGGMPPRDNGVVGGRPVQNVSGRPSGSIPRGTVIGAESGAGHARPPMAPGVGGVGGGTGAGRSGGPGSGGRRLANETGGVVGGRPVQTGITAGRPFTQGGSGLVRGGAPGTTRCPASRRENTKGDRPDYLTEDEETWQRNNRRVVPPVID